MNFFSFYFHRFHLDEAVVEEYVVASLHHLRQRLEGHGRATGITHDVFSGQDEGIPQLEFYRFFGPGKSAMMATRLPDVSAAFRMLDIAFWWLSKSP